MRGGRKRILREAFAGVLPAIRGRPKNPMSHWPGFA
jgi:hypothetical protein